MRRTRKEVDEPTAPRVVVCSLLLGVARIADLLGVLREDIALGRTDEEAIGEDWKKVGDDIRSALGAHAAGAAREQAKAN